MHQIPKLKCLPSRLVVVFVQWSQVLSENEDVVGAAPTGDAPTTSEWSTILLPYEVRLILETWRFNCRVRCVIFHQISDLCSMI